MSHLARNEASVVGPVGQGLHGGPAEGAGAHGLALHLLHLEYLLVGGADHGAGILEAHDVHAQGVEGDECAHIHAQGIVVEAVHPLGEGFPVPAEAQLHGPEGDGLDPGHEAHGGLAVLGAAGSEAEAALPDGDGGDAVPAGHGGVRLPVELEVVVGVKVDGPWCDDAAGGVQFLVGGSLDTPADHGDLAVLDGEVASESWDAA